MSFTKLQECYLVTAFYWKSLYIKIFRKFFLIQKAREAYCTFEEIFLFPYQCTFLSPLLTVVIYRHSVVTSQRTLSYKECAVWGNNDLSHELYEIHEIIVWAVLHCQTTHRNCY